ncbi:MAG: hypothetical protein K2X93_25880 [Candidatus Obscuribacterales bacterium]|nr:hypothetical protein [Candidatus Obscuribacterales bacterium]
MATKFYIIDDYTVSGKCIWDEFLLTEVAKLPSRPQGWTKPAGLPDGDWTMANGMWPMASDGAYIGAGIRKPTFEQLPVVFCVTEAGVEEQCRVTAAQAAAFVRARI